MLIDVYADSTGLFTDDFLNRMDSNIITLDIEKEIVVSYFEEYCNDNDISFDDWLDEYTCDDTEGLYEYAVTEMCGIAPIICSIG